MENYALSHRFWPVFQKFVLLQILVLAVLPVTRLVRWLTSQDQIGGEVLGFVVLFYLVQPILIGLLLVIPRKYPRLAVPFLVAVLLIITLGPIVSQTIELEKLTTVGNLASFSDSKESIALHQLWQLFATLLVPLALVAWLFDFRWVIVFSLGTAVMDLWMKLMVFGLLSPSDIILVISFYAIRTFSFLLVGYLISQLVAFEKEQYQALAEANRKLAHHSATLEQLTVSQERNRLARELHDTLAHTLSATAVQLEAVRSVWEVDPQGARALLDQSLDTTRTGLVESRRALKSLRSNILEDLGLTGAIREMARATATRVGLDLDLQIEDYDNGVRPDLEQVVFRIAQETFANVDRHAVARNLFVSLQNVGGLLELVIADDGQGFSTERVDPQTHFGLQGMLERAEMAGGRLYVESQPGQGTKIRFVVEDMDDTNSDL